MLFPVTQRDVDRPIGVACVILGRLKKCGCICDVFSADSLVRFIVAIVKADGFGPSISVKPKASSDAQLSYRLSFGASLNRMGKR